MARLPKRPFEGLPVILVAIFLTQVAHYFFRRAVSFNYFFILILIISILYKINIQKERFFAHGQKIIFAPLKAFLSHFSKKIP